MPEPVMTIWTRVQLPGFHNWPGAHEPRSYLRDRHRHLFVVTVWTEVHHDQRDTEFHDLQDLVRIWFGPGPAEFGPMSCEAIARKLGDHLEHEHDILITRIDVSEDDESGATYTPDRTS